MLKVTLENKWLVTNSIAIIVLALSIQFSNSEITTYVVPRVLYEDANTQHEIKKIKFEGYETFLEISDDLSVLSDRNKDELIDIVHLLIADLRIYNELISVGGTISRHTGMQNNSDGFVSTEEYRIVGTPFSILRRR